MSALLALILLAPAAVSPSTVSTVVVFPDRAQVTRTETIPCGPTALAVFMGLPPSADSASFRAVTSEGTVEGLQSEEHTREAAYGKDIEAVDAEILALEQKLEVAQQEQQRVEDRRRMAGSFGEVALNQIDREMVANAPPPTWAAAFKLPLTTRLESAAAETRNLETQQKLQRQLEDKQLQRSQMVGAENRQEYSAQVQVSCPPGHQARVDLSYMTGGARWTPSYEARADEANGNVELSVFATVSQATGEDWKGARLILSTAIPRQSATPPEIQRLEVYGEDQGPQRKVLVRRDEVHEHAEAESNGAGRAAQSSAGKPMEAKAQGISVQLVVPAAADVLGNGAASRIFVATTRLPGRFAFRTAPRTAPYVYRVADLVNSAPFPLLPGELDAYRRTGFVSRYPLQRVAQGEPFHLTFGIDDGLKVKRYIDEEINRDTGLFGNNHRFNYAYSFDVENYHARAEQVELAEQIAVSELDDVKVALDPKTSPGAQTRPEDGILTWQIAVKPGATEQRHLAFHVDVPSSYDLGNN